MSAITTDPIADLLARIRNALAVNKHEVLLPHSKTKEQILSLLKDAKFISEYEIVEDKFKDLKVTLQSDSANSRITGLERISKPGRRVYVAAAEIPRVMAGKGLVVISTSKGLMAGETARKQRIGGELMCKVW